MPIVIDSWEADGEGGYYIQWTDPSQDVTAYIHATPELMDEFIVHHRKHRKAPQDKLEFARNGMRDTNVSDNATVQRFKRAYAELVDDITDLRSRGLRHDTPHSEHVHIRQGMKPDRANLNDKASEEFKQFIERSSE